MSVGQWMEIFYISRGLEMRCSLYRTLSWQGPFSLPYSVKVKHTPRLHSVYRRPLRICQQVMWESVQNHVMYDEWEGSREKIPHDLRQYKDEACKLDMARNRDGSDANQVLWIWSKSDRRGKGYLCSVSALPEPAKWTVAKTSIFEQLLHQLPFLMSPLD